MAVVLEEVTEEELASDVGKILEEQGSTPESPKNLLKALAAEPFVFCPSAEPVTPEHHSTPRRTYCTGGNGFDAHGGQQETISEMLSFGFFVPDRYCKCPF